MTDQATNEIADFRTVHEAALFSASHPEHGTRVQELFALTAKHYGSEAIGDHGSIRGTAVESPPVVKPSPERAEAASGGQPLAGEAATALKAEIAAFRNQHSEALYESSHADHDRRVKELSEMTERLHGDKPANDPINEFSTKKAAVIEEALKPLAAEDIKIGQFDDFGKALPPYDEWDGELETKARTWMANGGVNEGEARGLMAAFSEGAQHDYSQEWIDKNFTASHGYLDHRYGDQKEEALTACKRVVMEMGGQELKDWLNQTGMGVSPGVVYAVSRIAERKGYIVRKAVTQK